MLNVVILDDYQNVSKKFGKWDLLKDKINLKTINIYLDKEEDLIVSLKKFDVLCLMRERTKITSNIIKKLPNLKLVITSGMWNPSVDLDALNQRKILLCGTENKIQSTAELSWLLIQLVWRNASIEFENIKNGKWQSTIGRTLYGKTLGIFGLGKQGKQVAKFGNAFGMNVIAWSHNLTRETCHHENVKLVTADDLFKLSDVLSVHTKLSERTRGFINQDKIKLMKDTSIIVNTSRGPIINEEDLIYSLKNKIIYGAGLDVFDIEPLPKNHELRVLATKYNLVLTPHIGYVSEETYGKFYQGYVDGISAYLEGKPINLLN